MGLSLVSPGEKTPHLAAPAVPCQCFPWTDGSPTRSRLHSTAQHSTAWCSTAQRGTAWHSVAPHGNALQVERTWTQTCMPALHITAQHSLRASIRIAAVPNLSSTATLPRAVPSAPALSTSFQKASAALCSSSWPGQRQIISSTRHSRPANEGRCLCRGSESRTHVPHVCCTTAQVLMHTLRLHGMHAAVPGQTLKTCKAGVADKNRLTVISGRLLWQHNRQRCHEHAAAREQLLSGAGRGAEAQFAVEILGLQHGEGRGQEDRGMARGISGIVRLQILCLREVHGVGSKRARWSSICWKLQPRGRAAAHQRSSAGASTQQPSFPYPTESPPIPTSCAPSLNAAHQRQRPSRHLAAVFWGGWQLVQCIMRHSHHLYQELPHHCRADRERRGTCPWQDAAPVPGRRRHQSCTVNTHAHTPNLPAKHAR